MSKALVFAAYGGPETQELVERPAPAPGPGELAIEVKAAGVNPADWKIRAGQMGSHWPLPAPMGRGGLRCRHRRRRRGRELRCR